MSLVNHVPSRGRVYVRRFDHEEAAVRRARGERVADLAAEYGVTERAVVLAIRRLNPEARARDNAYAKARRAGVCEVCGGPATRVAARKHDNPDGRCLCHRCRSNERRERLAFDETGRLTSVRCGSLDCANGERWQPPDHFTRGNRHREVREGGIHEQCRACQTRVRQRYREARKVPCDTCGKPCLPPNEKGRRGRADRACCRDCYFARTPETVQANRKEAAS